MSKGTETETHDELISRAKRTKAMRRFRDSLTKGNLFLYILRLLQQKDRYGYELREAVFEEYNFKMAGVTPYTVLYKMTKEKLIKLEEEKESPLKKPTRKYYKITPLGETLLEIAKNFMNETFEKLFNESSEDIEV